MKAYSLLLVLICMQIGCTQANHHQNSRHVKGVLIKNITLISSELDAPLLNQDVYLEGNKIVAIGQNLESDAAQIIKGTGKFLTPGLIDAHTHLDGIPGMSFEDMQANAQVVADAAQQIPKSYLYHGFTTVIDLHTSADSIARWNSQVIRPTAYFCGAAPMKDGYPMRFIPKPLRYQITPYFLMDGGPVPEGIDASQHTPQSVITRMKSEGAICVKTHYESGFGGRGNWPVPSLTLIRELKNEAKKAGLPVLLHANAQVAQRFGNEAGVDMFAHGMWTWDDQTANSLSSGITDILDKTIKQRIYFQPTVQVLYGERDVFNPEYLKQNALSNVLPKSVIDWYATAAGQSYRNNMAQLPYVKNLLMQNKWRDINALPIQRVMQTLTYMASNGAMLSFGSDTPSDMTFANPHGLNGRFEMKRWQEAGVTPEQFLKAATLNNAEFFNLEEKMGSIQIGKQADLLILKENPLLSIDAFDSIETVISEGKVLARESLSAREE